MYRKAIIVEDEPDNAESLKLQIDRLSAELLGQILIVGNASNYDEAVELFTFHEPDLVFLDNDLGEYNKHGYHFFNDYILSSTSTVVFITAKEKDPTEYFKNNLYESGIAVLHKPITDLALIQCLNNFFNDRDDIKYVQHIKNTYNYIRHQSTNPYAQQCLFYKGTQFPYKNIVYLKAKGSSTDIYFNNMAKVPSGYNLGYYDDLLCKENTLFKRLNDKYIINVHFYKGFSKDKIIFQSIKYQYPHTTEDSQHPLTELPINSDAVKILKSNFAPKDKIGVIGKLKKAFVRKK